MVRAYTGGLLDSTITTIAAPVISARLHGGPELIKWLGASHALSLGVLLVTGGRLGDRFGRRRIFLIGIAGFTTASLACGLAWDPAVFPREQIGKAFSAFGPILGLSAVGPSLLRNRGFTAGLTVGLALFAAIGGMIFATIYDIAIGDIDPAEAGSASGSLSSVQQLANAIGPAIITTIYFGALRGGQAHAMVVSLGAVIGIGVLSALAVPLLPRRAQAGH